MPNRAIWNRRNINSNTMQRIDCTILRFLASGKRVQILAHFPNRNAIYYVKRSHLEVKHAPSR
jgi:hypothetical protein